MITPASNVTTEDEAANRAEPKSDREPKIETSTAVSDETGHPGILDLVTSEANYSARTGRQIVPRTSIDASSLSISANADASTTLEIRLHRAEEATSNSTFNSVAGIPNAPVYGNIVFIRNINSLPQPFFVYTSPPSFPETKPSDVYAICAQAYLRVADSTGVATFDVISPVFKNDRYLAVYVVTGVAKTSLRPGVRVYASDAVLVPLAGQGQGVANAAFCEMTMPKGFAPAWIKNAALKVNVVIPDGGVCVQVDTSFSAPGIDYPFVGLGVRDPYSSEIVPVSIWAAEPGNYHMVIPSSDWRCARDEKVSHTIIDPKLYPKSGEFTLQYPYRGQVLDYLPNGKFTEAVIF